MLNTIGSLILLQCNVLFLSLQAQFVLCIIHTVRALLSQQCQFSKFISALLLLNSSIFFCLFMNFYVQAYKKSNEKRSVASFASRSTCDTKLQQLQLQTFLELNNNNSQDVLPLLSKKKLN